MRHPGAKGTRTDGHRTQSRGEGQDTEPALGPWMPGRAGSDGTFRYWAALCTLQLWLCRAAWHSSVVTPCTMACSWAYPPHQHHWAHSSGSLRPLPFTLKWAWHSPSGPCLLAA